MTELFLPQVQKIVFLMLENRSLDNLLGWLYTKSPGWNPLPRPQNVYPKGSSIIYCGLTPGTYWNPDPDSGDSVTVIPISEPATLQQAVANAAGKPTMIDRFGS
ncbi:MAG TPA: hypothetical protein VF131_02465 [Blastocatellia bacterium]|nr:hypothetical protein [Blastocatellia bacterium]